MPEKMASEQYTNQQQYDGHISGLSCLIQRILFRSSPEKRGDNLLIALLGHSEVQGRVSFLHFYGQYLFRNQYIFCVR